MFVSCISKEGVFFSRTRDEDEVDSVAAVLGDLVSYRAAGASHLEFLAGTPTVYLIMDY